MAGTITDLQALATDPNTRRVLVDGVVVLELRVADVETLELRVGQPWTDTRAAAAAEAIALQAARRAGFALLARRARTTREMSALLVALDHAPPVVERLVAEFRADGWLDDEAVARTTAEEIVRKQPAGRDLIVDRLRTRGIDDATALRIAATTVGDRAPADAAFELAQRRLAAMPNVDPPTAGRRLGTLLGRRGFDADTIAIVLDRLALHPDTMIDDGPPDDPA